MLKKNSINALEIGLNFFVMDYIERQEKLKEYHKKWVDNNRDKARESNRKSAKKNRLKRLEYQKLWREKNKEKVKESQKKSNKKHYINNRENILLQQKKVRIKKRIENKRNVKCKVCGCHFITYSKNVVCCTKKCSKIRILEYKKTYRKTHIIPDFVREKKNTNARLKSKYNTEFLTDSYIAKYIFKISVKDLPKSLIEAKRSQLQIIRFIRNQ